MTMLALLMAGARGSAYAGEYQITDLETLPTGTSSTIYTPFGLNDQGQVVGEAYTDASDRRAFLYSNGKMTDLGNLGSTDSIAYGINNQGQVVGVSSDSSGNLRPFLYSNGTMTALTFYPGTITSGTAYGINNTGKIAVTALQPHAYLYAGGTAKDLGVLGGSFSYAYGINQLGQVVGMSDTGTGFEHAFLYANGKMTDLGTLNGNSRGLGVNLSGEVVGDSDVSPSRPHAFLYANGKMTDLGTLGGFTSTAYGINDAGQIVGTAENGFNENRAFLDSNGTMQDLNSLIDPGSGWTLVDARGINQSGQIIGDGIYQGQEQAFLLTPSAVPEPSTLVMLMTAIGILGLVGYGRFRILGCTDALARLDGLRDQSGASVALPR
jgi:probable HAF family extracellular repeat protein